MEQFIYNCGRVWGDGLACGQLDADGMNGLSLHIHHSVALK